jgi:predicted Rossmann fold flavoprotein
MIHDLIVIGGGAAGIFAAIAAKTASPSAQVILLEKSGVLLSKVRISGGGRCNVTHACFDPAKLCENYPRGGKELLGPLHRFQPRDTIEWFEREGVAIKTESDGRCFPVTDSSETIIQCLLSKARSCGVQIHLRQSIERIEKCATGFAIHIKDVSEPLLAAQLILATGSSAAGHAWAEHLGHSLAPSVPSLFTFNVPTSPLKELSGIAVECARIHIRGTNLSQTGPLLITHFGFSGPAVLKLSAWGARHLYEKEYRVAIAIDWLPHLSTERLFAELCARKASSQKTLGAENPFKLPKNLWIALIGSLANRRIQDISQNNLRHLSEKLHADVYPVEGKTTHKEEFVTCGGVHLKEIDFKRMESKKCPGLFFAGEILDIDGVTGGFNFQNAWTTGFLAGTSAHGRAASRDA